ncbi:hypothetical protein ACFLX2_00840 [Candidatus Dependentiae bacterium]
MALKNHFVYPSVHLLLPATILLTTGIWHQAVAQPILPAVIALTVSAILIARGKNKKNRLTRAALSGLLFFLGTALGNYQTTKHNIAQKQLCADKCKIRGTVSAIEKSKQPFLNSVITVHVDAIQQQTNNQSKWHPVNAVVKMYTRPNHGLQVGDSIESPLLQFKQPKSKSFDLFLIKNGIATTAFLPTFNCTLLHRPDWHFGRWLSQKKKKFYEKPQTKNIKTNLFSPLFYIFGKSFRIKLFSRKIQGAV